MWLRIVVPALLLGSAVAAVVHSQSQKAGSVAQSSGGPTAVATATASLPVRQPRATGPDTLLKLLALKPEELAGVDIAVMNLLCADGLPGSSDLNMTAVLDQLDVWAEQVRLETSRHLYRVTDPKYAEHYRNSESYFRAEFLLQTLQEEGGVRYNPDSIYNPSCADSRDQFLHGLMDSTRGGTCVSMPVLYTAVGRRLGYPIKLVLGRGHVFCRWDDGKAPPFNIEGTNGFVSNSDDFYRKWPQPISDADMKRGEFLVSLTPAAELSVFLAARGHCYFDNKKWEQALEAYRLAAKYTPQASAYPEFASSTEKVIKFGFEKAVGSMPARIEVPPPPKDDLTKSGPP